MKFDPKVRLAEIDAAAALQWEENQKRIRAMGVTPSEALRKLWYAGWTQGAGWAHKNVADQMQAWGLQKDTAGLRKACAAIQAFPRDADGTRHLEPADIECAKRVLKTFAEMTDEALAMPEMQGLPVNSVVTRMIMQDLLKGLNALQAADQILSEETPDAV